MSNGLGTYSLINASFAFVKLPNPVPLHSPVIDPPPTSPVRAIVVFAQIVSSIPASMIG